MDKECYCFLDERPASLLGRDGPGHGIQRRHTSCIRKGSRTSKELGEQELSSAEMELSQAPGSNSTVR